MKNMLSVFCLLILVTGAASAAMKYDFGLNGGTAIATGDLADTHENGVSFGGVFNLATYESSLFGTFGANYAMFSGKTEGAIEFDNVDLFTVFGGLQIRRESGLYFVPAATLNFDEGDSRFGIDLGIGYLVPFGYERVRLDVSCKYSITSLNKEDGGKSPKILRLTIGFN